MKTNHPNDLSKAFLIGALVIIAVTLGLIIYETTTSTQVTNSKAAPMQDLTAGDDAFSLERDLEIMGSDVNSMSTLTVEQ